MNCPSLAAFKIPTLFYRESHRLNSAGEGARPAEVTQARPDDRLRGRLRDSHQHTAPRGEWGSRGGGDAGGPVTAGRFGAEREVNTGFRGVSVKGGLVQQGTQSFRASSPRHTVTKDKACSSDETGSPVLPRPSLGTGLWTSHWPSEPLGPRW